MELIPVESSSLESIGYDPQSRLLIVAFRNGAMYEYGGVPESVYRDLMEASSKGRFFHEHIREVYEPRGLRSRSRSGVE